MTGRALLLVGACASLTVISEPAAADPPTLAITALITPSSDARDVARVGADTWVATDGGLVVIDAAGGARTFDSSSAIGATRARSVSVTPGGVWVGFVDEAVLVDANLAGGARVIRRVPHGRVTRAVEYGGATWLASHGHGLMRVDATGVHLVSLGASNARARLTDLAVVGEELWVASSGAGIVRVGRDGAVAGRLTSAHGLPDDAVTSLAVDGRRVVVGTLSGLATVVRGRVVPFTLDAGETAVARPIAFARTERGAIWVGALDGGVVRIAPGARTVTIIDTRLRTRGVAFNELGHAIIAHDRGLERTDGVRTARLLGGGLDSGDVTAITRAFSSVWIGTFAHGLVQLDEEGHVVSAAAGDRFGVDGRINDLARTTDADGEHLWIATDRGLFVSDGRVFSPANETGSVRSWPAPDTHVTALHVDAAGALWVASARSLARYVDRRWDTFTSDPSLGTLQLHAVTSDAQRRVWAGGLHGLFRLDETTRSFTRFGVASGALPVEWVTALVPWERGVAIGTYHGGLAFTDGEHFRIERESPRGLRSGWINPHAVGRVRDTLLFGTLDRGLVIARGNEYRTLTVADGLPSNDVTAIHVAPAGDLWIGTRGGVARARLVD